jgi:hypothetical protein
MAKKKRQRERWMNIRYNKALLGFDENFLRDREMTQGGVWVGDGNW